MLEVLEIPDAPAELGPWLDRTLMRPGLAAVVDDLTAIHQGGRESLSAEDAREWLGKDASAVLHRGLASLDNAKLRQLLARPALLPAIQELVLVEGGGYWSALTPAAKNATPAITLNKSMPRWLFVVMPLALAASIAAFIVIDKQREPALPAGFPPSDASITRGTDAPSAENNAAPQEAWGWSREDLFDAENKTKKVSFRLADALNDWFTVTVGDREDIDTLRLHLSEMWAGCQQVLSEPDDQVSRALREHVSDLAERMQSTLRSLEQPPADESADETAARVKEQVDAWIQEAADAIRRED